MVQLPSDTGTIKAILPNGRAGFIKSKNNGDLYFKINSFRGNRNDLRNGLEVKFQVDVSWDNRQDRESKIAVNITVQVAAKELV